MNRAPPSVEGLEVVRHAAELVGLSYGATREAYCRKLYPMDQWAHALDMGSKQSACGLTALAVLRALGVDGRCTLAGRPADVILDPYAAHLGMIVAMLETIAWTHGVLRRADDSSERPIIRRGDIVLIGGNDGLPSERRIYGGLAHVIVVVGVDPVTGEWETVEGGQPDPQNGGRCTAILAKRRTMVEVGGRWYIGGRMIRWHFPAEGLARRV